MVNLFVVFYLDPLPLVSFSATLYMGKRLVLPESQEFGVLIAQLIGLCELSAFPCSGQLHYL